MTYPPFAPDGVWFIDHSSLEQSMACSRRGEYYITRKREPSGTRHPLVFGQAIHSALEAVYNPDKGDPGEILNTAFDSIEVPPGNHRDLVYAHKLLAGYLGGPYLEQRWQPLPPPSVELSFSLPLGEIRLPDKPTIRVVWTGRIDVEAELGNQCYVVDHKTCSVFGKDYFNGFRLSSQPLGYVWAAQQHRNRPFRGFIINALILHKAKPSFASEIFPVDPDLVEEWKTNTLSLLTRFLSDHYVGYHPKHTNACVGKYGPCPYYPVCSLPQSLRDGYLRSAEYAPVTWSPLD